MSVSAVIPVYNAGKFIKNAIESVLSQTVAVDEVIVVDDGSSDDTRDVVRSCGARVRLISQANQGASAARNNGVQAATSTFIAFLDADDRWFPGKLEKQLAAMRAAPVAILCYSSMLTDGTDGPQELLKALAPDKLEKELRLNNPLRPSCVLVSREAFLQAGGFRVDQIVSEDWDLWMRLLKVGPFCMVDEPTALYHMNNSGLSSDADDIYREARKMAKRGHPTELRGLSRWGWMRLFMGHQAYSAALAARSRRNARKELAYLFSSFYWWPLPTSGSRLKTLAVTLRNLMRRDV